MIKSNGWSDITSGIGNCRNVAMEGDCREGGENWNEMSLFLIIQLDVGKACMTCIYSTMSVTYSLVAALC